MKTTTKKHGNDIARMGALTALAAALGMMILVAACSMRKAANDGITDSEITAGVEARLAGHEAERVGQHEVEGAVHRLLELDRDQGCGALLHRRLEAGAAVRALQLAQQMRHEVRPVEPDDRRRQPLAPPAAGERRTLEDGGVAHHTLPAPGV